MDNKKNWSENLNKISKFLEGLFPWSLSKVAASTTLFMLLNFGWFAQEKCFGTDISKWNDFNVEEFAKRNRKKWDNPKEDVVWVSFVYIRTSNQDKTDTQSLSHFNKIKEYNKKNTVKSNEKIAVGCYHYFWHTKTDTQSQIDVFMKQYNKINKDKDGVVDLIPMLDVEHLPPNLNSKDKNRIANKALEWLKGVEAKSGTTPWIYINATDYHRLIYGNPKFNKYKLWLAAYSECRVNQKTGDIRIGPESKNLRVKPATYQFWEWWAIGGVWASGGKADMNNAYNIAELVVRNSDYRKEAAETSNILDFTYHRISFDKATNTAYKVYSYTIKKYWKNEQVLNRFAKNWWNTTDAIVTDESWNKHNPDITHTQGTKVYIKEKIQPWEYGSRFVYRWITTLQNKQYFNYTYTIASKGNYWWVLKKLQETWITIDQNILITDDNGKEYARDEGIDQFTKDQEVYVQIPVDYQPVNQ